MAEIEFAALARQCLSRRIGTQEELEREVQAWQQRRNEEEATVNWRWSPFLPRLSLLLSICRRYMRNAKGKILHNNHPSKSLPRLMEPQSQLKHQTWKLPKLP